MHDLRTLRHVSAGAAAMLALLLAGCASTPAPGPSRPGVPRPSPAPAPDKDGPEANPPADLDNVPDAEPRLEAVRPGGPNKPYAQSGRQYVPLAGDPAFKERGPASWYGRKFHGRPTASGELYNMYAMTAAHPTLPIPSYVRVRNPANGREVILRVNDRGPFHSDRVIDLSYTAALKLDLLRGVRVVDVERITYEQIRAGSWRRDSEAPTQLASASDANVALTPKDSTPAQPLPVPADLTGEAPLVPPPASMNTPPVARAFTDDAKGFWVQLGVFRQASAAVELQQKVERELQALRPLLAIFDDKGKNRLQAGPYRSRAEAQGTVEQLRRVLQLAPVIVERR
jgi:rare lipoprotein A